jgi:hypothetical protein
METMQKQGLTADEIGLLREISKWRRANGVTFFQWREGRGFGAMTEWKRWPSGWHGPQMNVTYEPNRYEGEAFPRIVATRDYKGAGFSELPVSSVTQAVDVLVALGYLPVRFSSAYRAGWDAAQSLIGVGNDVIADLEDALEPIAQAR